MTLHWVAELIAFSSHHEVDLKSSLACSNVRFLRGPQYLCFIKGLSYQWQAERYAKDMAPLRRAFILEETAYLANKTRIS